MELLIFLGVIGPWQIVLIAVLALLLFGGKKIPELMKGLGEGIKEFKKASKSEDTPQPQPTNTVAEQQKPIDKA